MEKVVNFLRDGENKLPPGFRFEPTDAEIVFGYLARKVFNYPLPASIIPEINAFSFNPWDLPGDSDQEKYFFSNKQAKYTSTSRTSRSTCGGYWRLSGSDKQIICSRRVPVVGIKKTLVFYKGRNSHASRTDWVMHLYCIATPGNRGSNIQQKRNSQGGLVQVGDWVLCRIFSKKSSKGEVAENVRFRGYDSMVGNAISDEDSSCDSSSYSCYDSDSSALTEVSSSSG